MASHIPLVEDGRVIGLDGKPLAAAPVNGWTGLAFEVHPHMRKAEVAHRHNPYPLVLLRRGAHGRSRIRSGLHTYELNLAPGQLDIFPSGFRMDHGWWDCTPGESIALALNPALVHELLHDEAAAVQLATSLSGRDPILERLLDSIRLEIDAGCPSGRLYADGLSLAVLACLRARHTGCGTAPAAARRLSAAQLRRTGEHVDAHLGADLGVAQLAALHGMSAYHFTRLFKAATGSTPHRFVLERRLAAARQLLAGDTPLAEIALAVGFSSQSHFTQAWRRHTGTTPGRARSG